MSAAPRGVLVADPAAYDVVGVENPHMAAHVGRVDRTAAVREHAALCAAFASLGLAVHRLPADPALPDLVFTANPSLPLRLPDGRRLTVLSRMRHASRAAEVALHAGFYADHADAVVRWDAPAVFEGCGDVLAVPARPWLLAGHGFRTERDALPRLAALTGLEVLPLELSDPDFYHLDTCFCVLDARSVMIYPGALRPEGLALIRRCFERIVTAPEDEARRLLACNAHCPDGRHVLIQRGCDETCRRLRRAGFLPVELDLSEFLKAGGSVFCMKQTWW